MNHLVTWFELPVTDMPRAKQFYADIMQAEFQDEEMEAMDGSQFLMSMFNAPEDAVSGCLIKGTDYEPSAKGVVVYLNGGEDLNVILERVAPHGGSIVVPKMPIEDGAKGWFAQFLDSEGNRVGLYSPPR